LIFLVGTLIMISGKAGELKTISWGAVASRAGAMGLCALTAAVMMVSVVVGLEAALMIATLAIDAAISTPAVADTRAIPVLRFM
jgi:hypothetical protein